MDLSTTRKQKFQDRVETGRTIVFTSSFVTYMSSIHLLVSILALLSACGTIPTFIYTYTFIFQAKIIMREKIQEHAFPFFLRVCDGS